VTVAELTDEELAWLEARRRQSRPALPDDELVSRYVRDMRRRGLRSTSIRTFTGALRRLNDQAGSLQALDRDAIEAWLDEMKIVMNTRNWYVFALHGFYKWALECGYIDKDPMSTMRVRACPRALPRPIPDDELLEALDQADDLMRCWLLLACLEGLRSQEIAGLSREDVLTGDMLLRVTHGKGGKERMLPLHPDVLAALERLPMPARGRVFLRPGDGRPLPGRTAGGPGGPYSPQAVSQRISTHLHNCGSDCGAHALRHWFGTMAYRSSRDLRLVQELLGHSSPITTAVYTKADGANGRPVVVGLAIPGRRTRRTGEVT
jgi:integrase